MTELWTPERQAERHDYINRARVVAQTLIAPHLENPDSGMIPLDEIPGGHPGQDPMDHCWTSDTLAPEIVTEAAQQVMRGGYSKMLEAAGDDPKTGEVIDRIGQIIDDKENAWLITPHIDIRDFPLGLKMVLDLLHDRGQQPDRIISILGKALTEAGLPLKLPGSDEVAAVPVLGAMGMLCHKTYLPWQKTGTTKDVLATLPKAEIVRHNQAVKDGVKADLDAGGTIGAQGPTGSTSTQVDGKGRRRLREVNLGAVDLLTHDKVWIVPAAMRLTGSEPQAMLGEPHRIKNQRQLRRVMRLVVAYSNELMPEQNLVYGPPSRLELGLDAARRLFTPGRDR